MSIWTHLARTGPEALLWLAVMTVVCVGAAALDALVRRVAVTYGDLVDDLTFQNYAFNRQRAPHISVARWERVFGRQVWDLERRLTEEGGVPVGGTDTPDSTTSGDAR